MRDFPELSPDLEWMLPSSQVDSPLLVEALLTAYYAPICQIAQALEPSAGQEAPFVRQVFIWAVNHRHCYRSGMDAAAWFYRIAMETIPASIRRSAWPPLAVALHAFTGLQNGQIAQILKIDPQKLDAQIEKLDHDPAATLESLGWSLDDVFAQQVNADWRAAFQRRFPAQETSEAQLEELAAEIARQAEQARRRQRWRLAIVELLLVGLVILLASGLFLAGNRLLSVYDPTQTPLPTFLVTRIITRLVTATPTPLP